MEILAEIHDYQELVSALRKRFADIGISSAGESAAEVSGLPRGYASRLLAPQTGKRPDEVRRIGLISLGPLLAILGVRLQLVEWPEALERYGDRLEKRNPAFVRGSLVRIEMTKQFCRKTGKKRWASVAPHERTKLARKAAKARHARLTPGERSEAARYAALARWRKRKREKETGHDG